MPRIKKLEDKSKDKTCMIDEQYKKRFDLTRCCPVCGEKGVAPFFGILACDPCRCFFGSWIKKKRRFKCKFSGNCEITKENRNKCNYCRFKKCLDSGMKKSYQRKKSNSSEDEDSDGWADEDSRSNSPIKIPKLKDLPVPNFDDVEVPTLFPQSNHIDSLNDNLINLDLPDDKNILNELKICEIKMKHPKNWHCYNSKELINDYGEDVYGGGIFEPLNEMVESTIHWTEAIGKLTNLENSDKCILIKKFVSKNIVLCLMYRSLINQNYIYVIENYINEKVDESEEKKLCKKFFNEKMSQLINKMIKLELTDIEFLTIKSMIFLDNNINGLSNDGSKNVLKLKESIIQSFIKYESKSTTSGVVRLCDILISTTSLLQITSEALSFNKILEELFNLNNLDNLLQNFIGDYNIINVNDDVDYDDDNEIKEEIGNENDYMN